MLNARKRRNRCRKSYAIDKHCRGEQRFLVPHIERQQQKKDANKNISRHPQRLHAVGFRQLKEFKNGQQRDNRRHHRQHRHRRPQDEHQHNRNQDDRGRDSFNKRSGCDLKSGCA